MDSLPIVEGWIFLSKDKDKFYVRRENDDNEYMCYKLDFVYFDTLYNYYRKIYGYEPPILKPVDMKIDQKDKRKSYLFFEKVPSIKTVVFEDQKMINTVLKLLEYNYNTEYLITDDYINHAFIKNNEICFIPFYVQERLIEKKLYLSILAKFFEYFNRKELAAKLYKFAEKEIDDIKEEEKQYNRMVEILTKLL